MTRCGRLLSWIRLLFFDLIEVELKVGIVRNSRLGKCFFTARN